MISTNIGGNIAQLRKSKGKTAEQMAEALRVSRQTISKWENGETIPDACYMIDIATYLDVPIADVYVQIVAKAKSDDKLSHDELIDMIEKILDPKSIEQAILAYDNNPNKFSIKIGVNIISYRDILLLASNMKHFMGYSETDNPVGFQKAKNEKNVMQSLASYLKKKNLLVLYAGSYEFENEENIIGAEFNRSGSNPPEGTKLMVILRNEKESLEFKKSTRELFTGLVTIEPERDWTDPAGMKYLLCHHEYDESLDRLEYTVIKRRSLYEDLSREEKKFLDESRKRIDKSFLDIVDDDIKDIPSYESLDDDTRKEIDELQSNLDEYRAEDAEENGPIQYIKDDSELEEIRKLLGSLDSKTRTAFAKASYGNFGKVSEIMILDLQSERYLPFWGDKASWNNHLSSHGC